MARSADWYYHRKGWQSCTRAQEFLAQHDVQVKETVDARAHLGPPDALRLARAAARVVVAKGKSRIEWDMRSDAPDDETLLAALLGPTGNLRAPTIRKGGLLLVGFHAESYAEAFGR